MNDAVELSCKPMPELTPEQAIRNLDQAVAQLSATRDVHMVLSQSISVLQGLIDKANQRAGENQKK